MQLFVAVVAAVAIVIVPGIVIVTIVAFNYVNSVAESAVEGEG